MNIHAHVQTLRSQIALLLLEYPELADDADFRADAIEGETDTHALLSKMVNISLEASSMAQAIKLRTGELSERKARFERKEEAARKLIMSVMDTANLPKVQLIEATLSTRITSPSPIVIEPDLLPDDCVRIERKPNMAAIKEAMESKREVPGVAMSNGKASLTIRTK